VCNATKRGSIMVENRMELYAVSTGVVLTALAALIPFLG
jgi:hypothetical protein